MNRGRRDRIRRLFFDLHRTTDALADAWARHRQGEATAADVVHAQREHRETCNTLSEVIGAALDESD